MILIHPPRRDGMLGGPRTENSSQETGNGCSLHSRCKRIMFHFCKVLETAELLSLKVYYGITRSHTTRSKRRICKKWQGITSPPLFDSWRFSSGLYFRRSDRHRHETIIWLDWDGRSKIQEFLVHAHPSREGTLSLASVIYMYKFPCYVLSHISS